MAAIFELDNTADTSTARSPRVLAPGLSEVRPRRSEEDRARRSPGMGSSHAGAPKVLTVALLGLAMAAILVLAIAAGSQVISSVSAQPVEASGEYHVVSEGDTLYSVAQSWDPEAPTAVVIERIRSLNGGVESVSLGEVLSLPRAVR